MDIIKSKMERTHEIVIRAIDKKQKGASFSIKAKDKTSKQIKEMLIKALEQIELE